MDFIIPNITVIQGILIGFALSIIGYIFRTKFRYEIAVIEAKKQEQAKEQTISMPHHIKALQMILDTTIKALAKINVDRKVVKIKDKDVASQLEEYLKNNKNTKLFVPKTEMTKVKERKFIISKNYPKKD